MNYGIITVLFCLEHYEINENYEVCAEIVKSISNTNTEFIGIGLPTKIDAALIREVREDLCKSFNLNPDSMFERYAYYANQIIESLE